MAKLVKYSMMFVNKNAIGNSYLVKATCEFCGKKFSSIEEAKKCENTHINDTIRKIK